MAENYQNKYQQVFHENSGCIVMNDPVFHQPVTLYAGQVKGLPLTDQQVKAALEKLDQEGLLTADTLWWAVYRVLTMPRYGYPTGKPEFCKAIENLGLRVAHRCVYDNWRNVTPHRLTATPDKWQPIENLGEAESHQRRVGIRLLELLA